MATGDQLKYSTDEFVEHKHACCSSCSDDGIYTTARHYCVDCEMYFCRKCVNCHNKIPSLKSHQVNDVHVDTTDSTNENNKAEEESTASLESLKCSLHQDKTIDTFCKDHGEVCCGTCALVKHRACSTESIVISAKNFKCNPEVKESKEELSGFLIRLNEEKVKRTDNIDGIGKQKLEMIEAVDQCEEKSIAKIKKLADISREEIRSIHDEHKTTLDNDVAALDAVIITTTTLVDKLDQTVNEPLLFATVKTRKAITRDGDQLLQSMETDWIERTIAFHIDETFVTTLNGMQSLGLLDDDLNIKEYKATLLKKVDVVQSINILDCCVIDSGEMLLADYNNSKLKRFHSDFQFKDEISFFGQPMAVCKLDKHRVAVRIRRSIVVHIVSVGQTMQLTSSFTIANSGWGMTYDAGTGQLLACEDNKVSVYNKSGSKLRTYEKDTNGQQIFSDCRRIELDENNLNVYVTDTKKGVIVLDKSGTLKMKVALSGVPDAVPMCLLPGGICLVGGQTSDVIVQLDKDGKQIGNLIDSKDGRTYTHCVVYDPEHSRLLVGGNNGAIYVYTLSAKH